MVESGGNKSDEIGATKQKAPWIEVGVQEAFEKY